MNLRMNLLALVLALPMFLMAQNDNNITSKFDFIPGEKVIFFDDFSNENIGDFPLQWNTNSSGEIITSGKFPGRWLQLTAGGYFIPEIKERFTDNFTVEFDIVPYTSSNADYLYSTDFIFVSGSLDDPNEGGAIPGKAGTSITPGGGETNWTNWADGEYKLDGSAPFIFKTGEKYHVSFWIQKLRLRMYVGEKKILDLPRAMIQGYEYNIFRLQTNDENKLLMGSFRVAAGLPDMRNKLITEGKLVSYGIQFDVNSDKLKPESFGTLKEIAQVLKDNPTVKIKIVGHTDSDGDDASNLDLSKRRAASVKAELSKTWGIDAARLETDGKGESVPVAANDNSMNKAKNRRVEFIKL